jgi:hypothetical protein
MEHRRHGRERTHQGAFLMAKKCRCLIDNQGVLTGYEEVEEADLPADAVAFDVRPDLDPGKYRWNGERFDPVNLGQAWYTPDGPDSWYAVFRALMALQKQGVIDFPAPVKMWLKYYHRAFQRPDDPDPGV